MQNLQISEPDEDGGQIIGLSQESTPISPGKCEKCNLYGVVNHAIPKGQSGYYCDCDFGQKAQAEEDVREKKWAADKAEYDLEKRLVMADVPGRFCDAAPLDFAKDVRKALDQWVTSGGTLYIWGDVGTGKSHLAAAVTNYFAREGVWGRFIITTELLLRIQESFGEKNVKPCKQWYRPVFHEDDGEDYHDAPHMWASALDAPFIVLDDIATEYTTEWAKARLFLLVNHRYNAQSDMIVTSNLSPDNIAQRIGDRTVSRLMHGATVIHLTGKDRRLCDAEA